MDCRLLLDEDNFDTTNFKSDKSIMKKNEVNYFN